METRKINPKKHSIFTKRKTNKTHLEKYFLRPILP